MTKVIHCPCGHVLRAESDEEVIRLAQEHAKQAHDMELSIEQALSMARPE
jgi:predicted small metal-binding protein